MQFLKVYLLFWLFSIFGWLMEVVVCSISDKKLVNRGFLLGPYCPIYGFGGVVILCLYSYRDEPLTCFILSMVICTIIEYISSYLMEKLFKVRWWDYSNDSFNINGRVCLRNSIAFGFLGMLCTSYLNPSLFAFLSKFNNHFLIFVSLFIFLITTIDIIVSFNVMNNIKKTISYNIKNLMNRDATNEIKDMIRDLLVDGKYMERRIGKAYRYFSYKKDNFLKQVDEFKEEVKKKDIFINVGTLCGLISSLILGLMTNYYKLWFTILIPIGFFVDIIIYKSREGK